ncbi:MAG: lipoyl synthase [Elusimicrobiota bacterium]|jgi:lipoic acid synthetase|nr:lipoyl synthase [Elusimicrobiota bacterium]
MVKNSEIPEWLKKAVGKSKAAFYGQSACRTQSALGGLHTVCREARCPNRGECFSLGDATIMILGDVCTRGCRFCAVQKAHPPLPPAHDEPAQAARTARELGLKYLVLTMPTRDDLPDGGARHIYNVITAVRAQCPACEVEPLISDLGGKFEHLPLILSSGCAVLAHNVETVPSLYNAVRVGADYRRSLKLLEEAKKTAPRVLTKSGIMLGMGESEAELKTVLKDLRAAGCDLLTLGQYLAPSAQHYAVKEYPEQPYYDMLKEFAIDAGFKGVMAGPLVRSSYKAGLLYAQAAGRFRNSSAR